jgi:hypothetical protein
VAAGRIGRNSENAKSRRGFRLKMDRLIAVHTALFGYFSVKNDVPLIE